MSFRRAQDHTYIAQLLGRMVRTPLAHRVEKDATLNDVHLYLPHYDEQTVNSVIHDLQNVEDVPPAETGLSRELVTLQRRKGTDAIFEATKDLVTYRVNTVRKQSALRRLMGLGRGLTQDRIDKQAQERVTQGIVDQMTTQVQRLSKSGILEKRAQEITGVDLKTIMLHGTIVAEPSATYSIDAAMADIDRLFGQAGRRFSNGLEYAYWKAHAGRDEVAPKVEAIVLSQDHEAMQGLEEYAEKQFDRLYEKYKWKIADLKEQRRNHYNDLRVAAAEPQTIPWILPESIAFRRTPSAPIFERHLYVEQGDVFRADLGSWEKGVLTAELADSSVITWLRNVDRQRWSLEIPYRAGGTIKPMFPDLLIVRATEHGPLFDILEPHDPSRSDNVAKAVGLAEFAESHHLMFDRVQLIRKKRSPAGKDAFYRLDVGKGPVRKQVLGVKTNSELDRIFDQHAVI